jgi:hypothetical protein
MNVAELIQEIQNAGVTLKLSPSGELKAEGSAAIIQKWLTDIRAHKAEIVTCLQSGIDPAMAFWRWRICFPDRGPLEVTFSPEATLAEVVEQYPDATTAEPVLPQPGEKAGGM